MSGRTFTQRSVRGGGCNFTTQRENPAQAGRTCAITSVIMGKKEPPHNDVQAFGAIFKAFLDDIVGRAPEAASAFRSKLTEHFGSDPTAFPVVAVAFQTAEQANVQAALDAYVGGEGRSGVTIGVAHQHRRFMDIGISDLLASSSSTMKVGPVEYAEVPSGPETTMTCIRWGLMLLSEGDHRLAILVRGTSEHGPKPELIVEVMAVDRDSCSSFIVTLKDLMRIHNVFRGKVVSLGASYEHGFMPHLGVQFRSSPELSRDQVILPAGLLERIERHTVGFARQLSRLSAAGRHVHRGLLLYGPPGSGKTHTVSYLMGQLADRTVLIMTGADQGMLGASFELARKLAPSMVVVEDIDLIAEERTLRGTPGRLPLLFALLNELDGLNQDTDVITVLTTNRADLLEPALADRPGRIDLAIEIPLPDSGGRRRLIDLYGRGLDLRLRDVDGIVARTEGASAAFIKELLRQATVLAAMDDPVELIVGDRHIEAALADLTVEGSKLTSVLLGRALNEQASH